MIYDAVASLRAPTSKSAGIEGMVRRIFADYPGSLAVRLWNGVTIVVGAGIPQFTLVFRAPSVFRESILRRSPLQLAHAYFCGDLDVEGDLYGALELRHHFGGQALPLRDKVWLVAKALSLRPAVANTAGAPQSTIREAPFEAAARVNTRRQNQLAIAFHYDLPSEFYRTWLDEKMVYSCAYFEGADDTLDDAQTNKLNHICRKLRLAPGERFLDIGCGWSALAIHAANYYGVHATGVTLSKRQFEWAQRRLSAEHLQDRVTIRLLDYRDIPGESNFDKVASVGMFEHVGLKNLPAYFNTVHRLLVPGGLFLNHGITHDEEGWNKSLSSEFINRYVFPDGELDTVSNVQRQMERAQFEIWDVEGLRPHYALTLRHWVSRLEAARSEALNHVDEATYRIWRLYMAGCALNFENGDLAVHQILASRRAPNMVPVPLTRRDLYR